MHLGRSAIPIAATYPNLTARAATQRAPQAPGSGRNPGRSFSRTVLLHAPGPARRSVAVKLPVSLASSQTARRADGPGTGYGTRSLSRYASYLFGPGVPGRQ